MKDIRIKHRHIALCVLLLCISLKIPLNNCAHFGERFCFLSVKLVCIFK